ncbi:MAG: LPS export ABC transporter permease LptF [Granulosicoccaceae bacterium]
MIIKRYIIREILLTLLAVTGVLLLIFFSMRFVSILGEVAAGTLPADLVLTLLGLQTLNKLSLIIPIGLFFAVLLGFGRMYRDHEMVALAACGVGQSGLAWAVMRIALLVAVVVALCAIYLSPWAARTAAGIEYEAQQGSELSGIAAGQFRESRDGNFILYVESIDEDRRTMRNVFVHSRSGERPNVLFSATGYREVDAQTGDEFMIMKDGYRYDGVPGQVDYHIVHFGTHALRLEAAARTVAGLSRKEMSTAQLWQATQPKQIAELQRRLILPLSTIALALLAVPLSRSRPREGRYARLFSAVLIYIAYNNLLGAAQGWVASGKLTPVIGLWWVPLLLLLLAGLYGLLQNHGKMPRSDAWFARLAGRGEPV